MTAALRTQLVSAGGSCRHDVAAAAAGRGAAAASPVGGTSVEAAACR